MNTWILAQAYTVKKKKNVEMTVNYWQLYCTVNYCNLKPQDSFGGFDKKKSRSSEITPNHQKASLNPPKIVLNDMF